jgi:hypothetical protein
MSIMSIALERIRSSVSKSSLAKAPLGTFTGILSPGNRRDTYPFTITRRGRFSAALTGLKANADLQLVTKGGRILAKSERKGRRSEFIQKTLKPGTYSIQVVRRAGRTRYTLSITTPSGLTTPPANPTPQSNLFQNLWGDYQGTSVTTTGLIDPVSRQFTDGPKSFQTNITARVKAPIAAGGVVESNPFNLSITSSVSDLSRATLGAIASYSALPNTQNILGQAWKLQYSGNQISGTLTTANNISSIPSAPNYFFADSYVFGVRSFFSSEMNAGTTLQGTLTSNELRLQLQGFSGNLRVFVIDITAQRV